MNWFEIFFGGKLKCTGNVQEKSMVEANGHHFWDIKVRLE